MLPPDRPIPEHIQIINSLMLRNEQHRGIMIPTMLCTGFASLILGIGLTLSVGRSTPFTEYPITAGQWVGTWIAAASCAILVTFFFAGRQAAKDRHALNTPQLRHVFRCLAPSLTLGFIAGIALCFHDIRLLPSCAALWIASYGVALLAIRIYATKSARFLGILMLALGLSSFLISLHIKDGIHPIHLANFFMTLAFGMFHLIVASGSILFAKLQD